MQTKAAAYEKEADNAKRELALLHSGSDSRYDKTEQLEAKLKETKVIVCLLILIDVRRESSMKKSASMRRSVAKSS